MLAKRAATNVPPQRPLICGLCGGELRLTAITDPTGDIVYRAPKRVPVLDSS